MAKGTLEGLKNWLGGEKTARPANVGPHERGDHYRLGLFVSQADGRTFYWHSGFWGTIVLYAPDAGVAVSGVTTNQDGFGAVRRLAESVEQHLQRYFDLHGDQLPPAGLYDRILREIERPLIQIALDASGGNQLRCAELLGINRNTLRKKVNDLNIEVTRRRRLM